MPSSYAIANFKGGADIPYDCRIGNACLKALLALGLIDTRSGVIACSPRPPPPPNKRRCAARTSAGAIDRQKIFPYSEQNPTPQVARRERYRREDGQLPDSRSCSIADDYLDRLKASCDLYPLEDIKSLDETLLDCWKTGRQVFIFGNGGSAGNAIHLANDWIYGISKKFGSGLRVTALPANSSVMTALANDEGYDTIFSYQLAVLAKPGDVAIALSGSGNSPNIVKALEYTKSAGIESYAILGFSGGKALALADHFIHVAVNDMQLAEDAQIIIGHLLMQWLYAARETVS